MNQNAAQVSVDELVKLGAVDTELFAKAFFPKAFRDESPLFAKEVWDALENPSYRLVNLEIFRGGAKTTRLRVFTAKRIAYGISRTILYIGPREDLATRSVQWLRSAIEPRLGADGVARPTLFAQAFGLKPGKKWQEHEIEIEHTVTGQTIWVLGVGITGTIRGINFEDYRPDLIVCDDLMTDEMSLTTTGTEKIVDLVTGAVVNSLAPATEAPNAKLAHLCTPLNQFDLSSFAKRSPAWHSESFGCWTKATRDLPTERQESSWPARYPSPVLRKEKLDAIFDNKYSTFAREKECLLRAAETLSFRPAWLRKSDSFPDARKMSKVLIIDPVPPPSERQTAKNLMNKDFEVVGVVGRTKEDFFLLDYVMNRGHEPNWTLAKIFELAFQWKVGKIFVEAVAYQRVLKWLVEKEMQRRGIYYPVETSEGDTRPKIIKITDALSGPASQGHFWCRPHHTEFILQFETYGPGYTGHDDVLDMAAMGVRALANPYLELGADEFWEEDEAKPLRQIRACP